MKTYSYLIVLCLLGVLFSPRVHAQTGIKVGGNLSRFGQSIGGTVTSITHTQVGEFKGGWQVGVWHHVVFSPKLGLGVEANYTGINEYYDTSSTRQINMLSNDYIIGKST